MHPLYNLVLEALKVDAEEMAEEGHDTAALATEIEQARATGSLDALVALQEDFWVRPSPPGFRYDEPNDWETISSTFPDPECHERFHGNEADLADRLLAAWQGRCAGCQLGKPVEGLLTPQRIKAAFEMTDSWPVDGYIRPLPDADAAGRAEKGTMAERLSMCRHMTRGHIRWVEPDDDIHYAITSQRVLEKHGLGFTGEQAVQEIRANTPQGIVFAAGLSMVRAGGFRLRPPATALFGNGYRQSLGAQIRCDPFGWVSPANPGLAARLAYRDAAASQRRNGIFSGIFFATLIADVLSHGDPARAIDTAALYVPPRSRFAEMIAFTKDACRRHTDWSEARDAVFERYDVALPRADRLRMNHCLPNAAVCILALLKGERDFTRALGISVMAGMDTDCNGATVGSVMGCALGTRGLGSEWIAPFNDTVRTELLGQHELRISDLASRVHALAKTNCRYAS
jgi:ADP-ribosylglycohydrolase